MSENGGDAVGDSLRENMQMEKLKALRPMNVDSGPQQTRKPAAGRADTKEVAKDIQDEVDERVRDTERGKSTGAHCDTLIEQVKAAHASGATKSDFTPTTSSTPLEVRRRPARPAAAMRVYRTQAGLPQRASHAGTSPRHLLFSVPRSAGCTTNVGWPGEELAPMQNLSRSSRVGVQGSGLVAR